MSVHFADRLLEAIAAKGSPVCVGVHAVFGEGDELFTVRFGESRLGGRGQGAVFAPALDEQVGDVGAEQ